MLEVLLAEKVRLLSATAPPSQVSGCTASSAERLYLVAEWKLNCDYPSAVRMLQPKAIGKAKEALARKAAAAGGKVGTLHLAFIMQVCADGQWAVHNCCLVEPDSAFVFPLALLACLRVGRTNFAKCVSETDCDALKHFKHILEERPMRVVQNALEPEDYDENGRVLPDAPVIVAQLSCKLQNEWSKSPMILCPFLG